VVRQRVEHKHTQAREANWIALLEVTAFAGPEILRQAYDTQKRIFQPARFALFGDAEVSQMVELVAARLDEALAVLLDPQRRSDYFNELVRQAPRPITLNPDAAAVAYLKAKVYLSKKLYPKALDALNLACQLDPSRPGYHARKTWTEYQHAGDQSAERLRQAHADLLRLYEQFPGDFWVNRLLANSFRLQGQPEQYAHHLERAFALRPDDLDTAREHKQLRLAKA
jgi:tetratricopeptide (TPR) repeat protein